MKKPSLSLLEVEIRPWILVLARFGLVLNDGFGNLPLDARNSHFSICCIYAFIISLLTAIKLILHVDRLAFLCGLLTQKQGKRLFIKDMAYYLMPADGKPPRPAPSLHTVKRGIGTNGTGNMYSANGVTPDGSSSSKGTPHANGTAKDIKNPTVVPVDLLEQFHYAFLIRDPHYSIPSYYRCTIPPLDKITGWYHFDASEAGYDELRRFFNYVNDVGFVGPSLANDGRVENGKINGVNGTNGTPHEGVEICVVDADDLLDNPAGIIERFCNSVRMEYTPDMLTWDTKEAQSTAKAAFEKWTGWHEDALSSSSLKPRAHKKAPKTEAQFDEEWREKYGEEGAKIIRSAVDKCMPDYLYLKKFTIKA